MRRKGFASPAELKRADDFASKKLDAAIAKLKLDGRLDSLEQVFGTGAANQKVLATPDALVTAHGSATTKKGWAARDQAKAAVRS